MAVFTGNGSAASPSLTFSSDTDTGIFRNGPNGLAFASNGAERLRIEEGGIVNIFSDTPNPALRITQLGPGNVLELYDQSADDSPFIVNSIGQTVIGRVGAIRSAKLQTLSESFEGMATMVYSNDGNAPALELLKSRGGVIGTNQLVINGDNLGQFRFYGADNTGDTDWAWGGAITCTVNGTPAAGDMPANISFSTRPAGGVQPLERVRIRPEGGVGIGGSGGVTFPLVLSNNITGDESAGGFLANSVVQADVTNTASVFLTQPGIASGAAVGNLFHYNTSQGIFSGTVTNQIGYYFGNNTGASVSTYAFASDLDESGGDRYSFWGEGTAWNLFRGRTGVGSPPNTFGLFFLSGTGALTGQIFNSAATITATVASDVTSGAFGYHSQLTTTNAAFTLTELVHFNASPAPKGAASTISNQYGFYAGSNLTDATTNYGFYGNIGAGSGRWNIFMNGTAENYLGGNLKIGGTAARATTPGTNQIILFNGTAPVGTLTGGVSFYSTAGEARVMDAAGNATLLSPHDKATNEWIYDSVYTPTGQRLRIRMEAMMKAINDHFGWDFIEEFAELA
jgi:hypothetical protein